ncbi:MAG: phenylalanine--tRNA ligase subunit alpha, partial [Gemmatimonadota bacterium]
MSSKDEQGNLRETLESIRVEALEAIQEAEDSESLEKARVRFLGRNGLLSRALSGLKNVPAEERPEAGKTANQVKRTLETTLEMRVDELASLLEPEETVGPDLT